MEKKKLKLRNLEIESFVTNKNDNEIRGGSTVPCAASVMSVVYICDQTHSCNPSWPCGGGSAGMCSPDTPDSWGTCAY